jgi:hypothetical protein
MKRLALLGAALLFVCSGAQSEESTIAKNLAENLHLAQVSDADLFAMCCWARGRSGFNHCTEYGVCVDSPGQVCTGRGPAEGMTMTCKKPADGKTERRLSPGPGLSGTLSRPAQDAVATSES